LEKILSAAGTATLIQLQNMFLIYLISKIFCVKIKRLLKTTSQEHPVHSNLTILSISFIKISKVCTSIAGPGR